MEKYYINRIINWVWATLAVLLIVGCVKHYHDKIIIEYNKTGIIIDNDTINCNKEKLK